MSTYIKKGQPLEFDNSPPWLTQYMRYRLTVLGNSKASVMTYFKVLREFAQWRSIYNPKEDQQINEEEVRNRNITALPLSKILNLKKKDIENYLFFIADSCENQAGTRSKKLTIVRSFYEYLIDEQETLGIEIENNPALRIKNPKLPEKKPVYLPEDDQQALLSSGATGENEIRDYAIYVLFLSTGMRISEVTNIDLSDLNLTEKTILIRNGKGGKDRLANLSDACCSALQYYIQNYRNLIIDLDTPALFVTKRYKKRITERAIEKAMAKAVLRAKLGGKGYTPHKFRHTTATMLAKEGQPLQIIQQVLGHSSTTTTEIYTHLSQEDVKFSLRHSCVNEIGKSALESETNDENKSKKV